MQTRLPQSAMFGNKLVDVSIMFSSPFFLHQFTFLFIFKAKTKTGGPSTDEPATQTSQSTSPDDTGSSAQEVSQSGEVSDATVVQTGVSQSDGSIVTPVVPLAETYDSEPEYEPQQLDTADSADVTTGAPVVQPSNTGWFFISCSK